MEHPPSIATTQNAIDQGTLDSICTAINQVVSDISELSQALGMLGFKLLEARDELEKVTPEAISTMPLCPSKPTRRRSKVSSSSPDSTSEATSATTRVG